MQQKLGLIGKKLGHSFSPDIFREFGYPDYELVPLAEDKVIDYVKNTPFRGMNVTIPYKEKVAACCDRLSDEAGEIGCVNALVKEEDGTISGYNTDVYGIMGALQYAGIKVAGKKVLVLGGGGTSLTARYAARKMGAAEVLFVSRKGPLCYEHLSDHRDVQIIINTTSVGMFPDNAGRLISLADFPCCEGVFDVVYNPLRTNLIMEAGALGIPCISGLYMLVEQARVAAELFTGKEVTRQQGEQVYKMLKEAVTNTVMVGLSDSGKRVLAKILKEQSGRKWIDIDSLAGEQAIEEAAKMNGVLISIDSEAAAGKENRHRLKQNGKFYYMDQNSRGTNPRNPFGCNIVLTGFMGTGKSTVAELLGKMYGMNVAEMDEIIAERENMSISDIFAAHGEEYFRNLETRLLVEMLSRENVVISCGGGVVLREQNVREMKKKGKVILLTASPEVILERIRNDEDRPLLNGNKNVDSIRDMFEKRRPKYESAADIIIQTDDKSVREICEELVINLL